MRVCRKSYEIRHLGYAFRQLEKKSTSIKLFRGFEKSHLQTSHRRLRYPERIHRFPRYPPPLYRDLRLFPLLVLLLLLRRPILRPRRGARRSGGMPRSRCLGRLYHWPTLVRSRKDPTHDGVHGDVLVMVIRVELEILKSEDVALR